MRCNIDARGKVVRLMLGGLGVVAAVTIAILLYAGYLSHGAWWAAVLLSGLGGLFGVYEGWAGWCVVRAMGFRTPV